MASITYSGSFDVNPAGADGLSATANGSPLPSNATITNITYTLKLTSIVYSSVEYWRLLWFAVGGKDGRPSASAKTEAMSDNKHTFSGSMSYSQSDVDKFVGGSFEVYAKANTTHNTTSYMGDFTIKVSYTLPTKCSAPETVTLSASSTMDSTVKLSWSGAKAGTNNPIAGYMVDYADSSDNSSWSSWTTIDTFDASPQTVDTPEVGVYRKFRVWTIGEEGGDYEFSETATSSGSVLRLQTVSRCTAPQTVTIAKPVCAAETNTLSWSGAEDGTNNAISGYYIQYADSADNATWGSWTGDITVGVVDSASVPMPAANTYRKYRVYTLGTAGSGWRSTTGTESSSTYRGHAELEGFTDSPLVVGETLVKALHMQELQDRVNTLRSFYGLSTYGFSTITSGVTGLKDWTAHVNEIRAAVDDVSTDHAAWIAFSVNCPRADVIEQLRAVILSI